MKALLCLLVIGQVYGAPLYIDVKAVLSTPFPLLKNGTAVLSQTDMAKVSFIFFYLQLLSFIYNAYTKV